VFGSIMASHFTSTMVGKLEGTLPASVLASVKDNVGQALGVARRSSAAQPFGTRIVDAANESFVSGLHVIGLAAAGITFVAAIAVALFLPARAHDHEPARSAVDRREPSVAEPAAVG